MDVSHPQLKWYLKHDMGRSVHQRVFRLPLQMASLQLVGVFQLTGDRQMTFYGHPRETLATLRRKKCWRSKSGPSDKTSETFTITFRADRPAIIALMHQSLDMFRSDGTFLTLLPFNYTVDSWTDGSRLARAFGLREAEIHTVTLCVPPSSMS
jgi:hypothetical protein